MPAASNVAQTENGTVHRSVRLRLLPESRAVAHQLAGTAGACRFVWNYFLARTQQEYAAYREGAREQGPQVTFFSLGQEFTALRRDPLTRVLKSPCSGKMAAPLARPHCECQHK